MTLQDGGENKPALDEVAWTNLCEANGWVCKFCGSCPEVGGFFEGNVCEDCAIQIRNA